MTKTVAVIGTGFSGVCAAIKLKEELNIHAELFEMSTDVGGTWRQNTYPGAECDIPSHLYSLSFELNPNWTKNYSGQAEIHEYLQDVARKYNLYEQIRFETEVISMEWDQSRKQWLVQWRDVKNHDKVDIRYYDFVFAGLGPLRIPHVPEELKGFEGPVVHTTYWDHTIDFTNKRVAIVGSGASAVQVIPELRKIAAHVYSYQRTPAWVIPRDQYRFPRIFKFLLRWVPFLARFYRNAIYLQNETTYVAFGYANLFITRFINWFMRWKMAARLKRVGRPDLIPVLTPNYSLGCKRVCKSEVFLEACAKPNVTVIPSAVAEIKGRIVIDKYGNEHQVDILVLATGFDVNGFAGNLKICGINRRNLLKEWQSGFPMTYKSVSSNGFPNAFLLLGPSSGLGHNSVITIIECQIDFAINAIKLMLKKGAKAIEPTVEAQGNYVSKMRKDFGGTTWKKGCMSYYLNEQGEPHALWPNTVTSYWWNLKHYRASDFNLYT